MAGGEVSNALKGDGMNINSVEDRSRWTECRK